MSNDGEYESVVTTDGIQSYSFKLPTVLDVTVPPAGIMIRVHQATGNLDQVDWPILGTLAGRLVTECSIVDIDIGDATITIAERDGAPNSPTLRYGE